jgi:hypothetical protein
LHDIKEEKPYFQNLIDQDDIGKVFAVKVKLDNQRILQQKGAFLIYGVEGYKANCGTIPADWVVNLDIQIACNQKRFILDELDYLGINQSGLFPEIDFQSKHLKMIYK